MRLARTRLTLAVAGVTLALAACGGGNGNDGSTAPPTQPGGGPSGRTAEETVAAAVAALGEVDSVRYVLTGTDDGVPVAADLRLAAGDEMTGTITNDGEELEVLRVDDTLYVRGETLLGVYPGLSDGQWITFPVDGSDPSPSGTLASLTLSGVTANIADIADAEDARVEQATEQDQPVVVVRTATDTLAVADTGPARPLRHTTLGENGDRIDATFSEYDEPVDITAPDAADVLDLDEAVGTG